MTGTHETPTGSSLDQQRAALANKLAAALQIPSDLVDLVRSADAGLGKLNAEAAELQAQIDAVDSQLGLRELDRRSQAEKAHQEKLANQRAKLVDTANEYLEAISAAESAARTLAASVQHAFESNARLAVIARDLAPDGKSPGPLNAMELEKQLALRIASVLSTIPRHSHRLGDLAWPSAARSFFPPGQNWVEAEGNRLSARVLQPLIAKGN
jgi:hypothetical protein